LCAILIAALTLLAGPTDPGPIADQALDALRHAPNGRARAELCRRLAAVALPENPSVALEALLLGVADADSVPLASRAQVESILEAFGEAPVSQGLPLSQWREVVAGRGLARLLTYSLSRALGVVTELKLPNERLACALADAAYLDVAAPGGAAGKEAAALALDLLSDIPEPPEDLLRQIVKAVLTTDPQAGDELCLRTGSARAVACEVRCESAPDAATALSAVSGIVDPARRCEALVRWVRASEKGGSPASVLSAATSAAEAVQDPATRAALLAELVDVGAGGSPVTSLVEHAASVAYTVADPGERAIAIAVVAASAVQVDAPRAHELLSQSLALAKTVSGEGPRARALRWIGVAVGPSLPADALQLAADLGSARSASKVEVLVSACGTRDPAACTQAVNELLRVVDVWDTSPTEKLLALTRAEAQVGAHPGAGEERGRAAARAALRKRIGCLKAERADRLTDPEERVLTLLEAAELLVPLDRAKAAQALAAALASAGRMGEAARVRQVLAAAAAVDGALPLTLARGLTDPGLRALSLSLAGDADGAQAAAGKVDGAWARAEALLTVAECVPSVDRVRAAVSAVGALAQGQQRDALALRAVDAALACDGEGRWDVAAGAGALAAGPAGLARAQLKLAEAMMRAGRADEARDRVEQAAQLVDLAGRPEPLVADLAAAREQVGQDGLALATALGVPLERARAQIMILDNRHSREAAGASQ